MIKWIKVFLKEIVMIKSLAVLSVFILSGNSFASIPRYEVTISVLNEQSEIVSMPKMIVNEGLKGEMYTGPLNVAGGNSGHHFGIVANKMADGNVKLEFSSHELKNEKIELIMKDQHESEVEFFGLLDKKLNKYRFKVIEL